MSTDELLRERVREKMRRVRFPPSGLAADFGILGALRAQGREKVLQQVHRCGHPRPGAAAAPGALRTAGGWVVHEPSRWSAPLPLVQCARAIMSTTHRPPALAQFSPPQKRAAQAAEEKAARRAAAADETDRLRQALRSGKKASGGGGGGSGTKGGKKAGGGGGGGKGFGG